MHSGVDNDAAISRPGNTFGVSNQNPQRTDTDEIEPSVTQQHACCGQEPYDCRVAADEIDRER
jgi:hypothetical protein